MKKSDISAHVVAETSLSKADAAGAVDADTPRRLGRTREGGVGQHRGVRNLLRRAPCGPAGEEFPDCRERRHCHFEGAVVQGRKGSSRWRQLTSRAVAGIVAVEGILS